MSNNSFSDKGLKLLQTFSSFTSFTIGAGTAVATKDPVLGACATALTAGTLQGLSDNKKAIPAVTEGSLVFAGAVAGALGTIFFARSQIETDIEFAKAILLEPIALPVAAAITGKVTSFAVTNLSGLGKGPK